MRNNIKYTYLLFNAFFLKIQMPSSPLLMRNEKAGTQEIEIETIILIVSKSDWVLMYQVLFKILYTD